MQWFLQKINLNKFEREKFPTDWYEVENSGESGIWENRRSNWIEERLYKLCGSKVHRNILHSHLKRRKILKTSRCFRFVSFWFSTLTCPATLIHFNQIFKTQGIYFNAISQRTPRPSEECKVTWSIEFLKLGQPKNETLTKSRKLKYVRKLHKKLR